MASGSSNSTVYIGNLDERVGERVLYDILIQAGRVIDLHLPRDKESDKPKGFAFAEFESPEIADYAVRLFSGLITLHHRTLKFAISGQDKASNNTATATTPGTNSFHKPRTQNSPNNGTGWVSPSFRLSSQTTNHHQGYAPPGLNSHGRVFGSAPDFVDRSRSRRHDPRDPVSYTPY